LNHESDKPFETIEGAQQYVRLLHATVLEAKLDVEADVRTHIGSEPQRRLQALRLVSYRLENLDKHLKTVLRTLNDLRTLRRLLLQDRVEFAETRAGAVSETAIHEFDGAC
jgi:hypothetical protein